MTLIDLIGELKKFRVVILMTFDLFKSSQGKKKVILNMINLSG